MSIHVSVVDANVIIAAFMKDSYVRRIILGEHSLQLITPDYIESEIAKYVVELSARTGMTAIGFEEGIKNIFEAAHIQVIPKKEYESYLEEAIRISPDQKDVPYFALALKFDCPIWTHDKRLRSQKFVPILNTNEIAARLESKKSTT